MFQRHDKKDAEDSHPLKESLKTDLFLLQDENSKLKAKCIKLVEIQNKVELVMKQNGELISQNEKISKLLHEKKTDYQILKNKYDNIMSHRQGVSVENQFERKKLLNQIDHLQNQIHELQHSKNIQINEIKAQGQLQIQALKRQNTSSHDLFEQQIRKLKEQIDRKDYDVSDQMNRYKRLSSQSQYEGLRLKEEKEKLKNELIYLQNDHKSDIENLKQKLESNYSDQIETLKRNHNITLENIESENVRLKDYLENRGYEIEELNAKIIKQKNHFEETINLLRKENENIRLKMIEGERFMEAEVQTLKIKLSQMHEQEIQEIKVNHQRYVDCLQGQILKMQTILRGKSQEIEESIQEKTSLRHTYHSEGNRLREEIEENSHKIRDLEMQLKGTKQNYEYRLKEKEDQLQYLRESNSLQVQKMQKEFQELHDVLQNHKNELQQERGQNSQKQQDLLEKVLRSNDECSLLKDKLQREKAERERQVDDVKNELGNFVSMLQRKVDSLTSKQNILERENQSLKNTMQLKEKEVLSLKERIQRGEEREEKYKKQMQDVRVRMNKKDQKGNDALGEQKKRLENSFAFTIQSLKLDHEKVLKLEKVKYEHLEEKLSKKERELAELLKSYKKMRGQFEDITEQEANRKELTLKYPGATSNLIATKNLFDVYLKTKVLDVCGDAINKQNPK